MTLKSIDVEQGFYINPEQIGLFKVEKHHAFIKEWIKDKPGLSFDLIWAARETWIRELTGPPPLV